MKSHSKAFHDRGVWQSSRRSFLKNGTLLLASSTTLDRAVLVATGPETPVCRCGLLTDLHYADKPAIGSRHYRETPAKLSEAAREFGKHELSFILELGDLVDAADSVDQELEYLKRINRDFSEISPNRHYVLGNHCVFTLTKPEFLETVGQPNSFYSFDTGDIHFVVLDACFRSDGEPYGRKNFQWTDSGLPDHELEWLRGDLQQTSLKTIVFTHQRLDVKENYAVKNAPEVRKILEDSGNVLAVFQGHSHQNDVQDIAGIHYCTLVAMVEGSGAASNGYSVMSVAADGTITVTGFRNQSGYNWSS